jgi:phenylacetate-coenzyme A ligase PaaK-like adenylate-forming protein
MIEKFFDLPTFGLESDQKNKMLLDVLNRLTLHHSENCYDYKLIVKGLFNNSQEAHEIADLPYLPVNIFKTQQLKSIKHEDIYKTMKSSGTSGNGNSQIILDKFTSNLQAKALRKTISSIFGENRSPMMFLDSKISIGSNGIFSARGAAIRGFSIFGRENTFALDDNFQIDVERFVEFFDRNKNKTVLLFGFTFIVWEILIEKLANLHNKIDMSNAVLLHGGGWKKLADKSVSGPLFKEHLSTAFNLNQVFDYYGMVEQTGSIYLECPEGFLHTSCFNEILIRDPISLNVKRNNERGLVQTISILPHSYPGHSILTEDVGILMGEDDCKCGKKGKYFKVLGRTKNSEIRGCSDAIQ